MLRNGYPISEKPILKPLDTIENRDALIGVGANGAVIEKDWPVCDAIVGNPPFLGGSKKRGELGDAYFDALAAVFANRVPAGADLVCYWFEKARTQIAAGKCRAAGLVATNSIRGGANRVVLDRIIDSCEIFDAWADEDWINEGAAVRVSLVCYGEGENDKLLDGNAVNRINSDLTADVSDLTAARSLPENAGAWAYGSQEKGNFSLAPNEARRILMLPNPNGQPNSDVIRRAVNARQMAQRREDDWVVDFGLGMSFERASLYEAPFAVVQAQVAPARLAGSDRSQARYWWRHARPSPKYRAALVALPRVIATPCVSKHRLFVFVDRKELVDHAVVIIARADYATFGILHSRFHELWSLGLCTWLGVGNDPRYTPTTTFETFPFPEQMTPSDTANGPPSGAAAEAIAAAAKRLNELRENWLNPPEWTDRIRETVPGYPDRVLAKPGHEAELKTRTLTNLYNARPAWLDNAHKALDTAVATAYGWTDYTPQMADEEILRRLLALNIDRASTQSV
jgi:type II restriction/modification system DNA methylase subunit YeeA